MNPPVFIIAEIGNAHDGSLGMAHAYIDAAAEAGVDAVKFQTHIAEAESSALEPFRVKFSYEDATRYDYWKRMEFTFEQWAGLQRHCEEAGVEFMSSPFSQMAVDWLENLGVQRHKIASGEVNNFLMLEKIARTGKPVILSSGMSSYPELDAAVALIESYGNPLSVLQCTTAYPTPYEQLGLNVIGELRARYPRATVGLSDHTGEIYAALAAVALGARVLEFHLVFDRRSFGPDARSSLMPDEARRLVQGVRKLERAFAHPVDKSDASAFAPLKQIFEKTLAVNKDLPAGHVLQFEDLESKKPKNQGIAAERWQEVVGKKLRVGKGRYDFLQTGDIA
jgi:N-acetylneuraminate synthase